ncbi:DUF4139 domain-containing protein [Sphingomonas sp. DBB INV C78]|uniref:DUF4139 domain-containing protein n=1 Tax=Sphingomonas sp. DBB INV C78 TaxID=3349434 RepID=UPI0036D26C74
MSLAAPAGAAAVSSAGPDTVSVTVYRNPDRSVDEAMNLDWLEGFALITETRTISLPPGDAEIRFEGVAGGILPQSAIVSGLPGGVSEKNRDARLLAPGALLDAHLGRRIHLRRTSRATGAVREMDAVVRTGPDDGVVLETADGIEALRCSGLSEALSYDSLPAGLSDKPTLAVRTHNDRGGTVTVTLSYLADQFDWQANYVAQIAQDGRTLDLFGWLTLANGNGESFVGARTQAVAGTLNRAETADDDPMLRQPWLAISCWPMGNTSSGLQAPPPPAPPPPPALYDMGEDIVVTAQRRAEVAMSAPVAAMMAGQEELGDLKLYRIPERVTVAANAMKQVAFLDRRKIAFDRVYTVIVDMGDENETQAAEIRLRTKNVAGRGLGLPLPSGQVAMFEPSAARPMLIGEAPLDDIAVGQDVELRVGDSPQVQFAQRMLDEGEDGEDRRRQRRYEIELTNANPHPVTVEVSLRRYSTELHLVGPSARLEQKNGRPLWIAKVPANGTARLRYKVRREEEE